MAEFKALSPLFDDDIREAIKPETCVANRNSLGGTSYRQVENQLKFAKDLIEVEHKLLDQLSKKQIYID